MSKILPIFYGSSITAKIVLQYWSVKTMRRRRRKQLKECQEYREPFYGFRVKVTLVDNEMCTMDVTCTADGKKIRQASDSGNQRGFSEAVDNLSQLADRLSADLEFGERQTGENFLSAAPVDCRTTRCPNG